MDSEVPAAVDVWVGVDVGKKDHHAVALDASGKVLFDRSLPQDEHLRRLITELKKHGSILFVVDQPATIGALPLAVARTKESGSATYRGLPCAGSPTCIRARPRPIARDAAIIAQAARSMPHALRSLRIGDDTAGGAGHAGRVR